MESFNLQSFHQNEFEQKEGDNLEMLASIASFYPQLSISGEYDNHFTEKNIQNEMGFQQQNYIDPAIFYYQYFHNFEQCYYHPEINIFPPIQEFLRSQQLLVQNNVKE